MKALKNIYSIVLQSVKLAFGSPKIYYEHQRKSRLLIFCDLIYLASREREFCSLYYALGYDKKGARIKGYMGKKRIFKLKHKVEHSIKRTYNNSLNYDVVTKDKFYAGSILKGNGFPCLEDIGLIVNKWIFTNNGEMLRIEELNQLGDELVLKNTVLEASEGVIFFHHFNNTIKVNGKYCSNAELAKLLKNGVWVVQLRRSSHPALRAFNSTALNVLRIVTILDEDKPILLEGFQAFATGIATTDSWSEGSIYVGIDFKNLCLKQYGFRSPWHEGEGLIQVHPDSGLKFAGFQIPFLKEAVDLCLKAHAIFYTSFFLGWDVAITETGPVIVEVNEKPGMNVLQCTASGIGGRIIKYANLRLAKRKNQGEFK